MKIKILFFIEFILAISAIVSGIANFYVGYYGVGVFDFITSGFCFWAGIYNVITHRKGKNNKSKKK